MAVTTIPVEMESGYAPTVCLPPFTKNLVNAAATGAGSAVFTGDKGYTIWVIRASAVTSGGTVLIEGCEKDSATSTDWYTLASVPFTANGSQYVAVATDEFHMYQRSNFSARTDGTINTFHSSLKLNAVLLGSRP